MQQGCRALARLCRESGFCCDPDPKATAANLLSTPCLLCLALCELLVSVSSRDHENHFKIEEQMPKIYSAIN